jgi:trk system potassium uptake protein TrkA
VKLLVIGCGRVGSAVARAAQTSGWEVVVVDEAEEALTRLGDRWPGEFHVGHGLDSEVLERAGIGSADSVVVATDGDNTNLVVGQVAKLRYGVANVAARVLDPARAEFYAGRGVRVVCPTNAAVRELTDAVLGERV